MWNIIIDVVNGTSYPLCFALWSSSQGLLPDSPWPPLAPRAGGRGCRVSVCLSVGPRSCLICRNYVLSLFAQSDSQVCAGSQGWFGTACTWGGGKGYQAVATTVSGKSQPTATTTLTTTVADGLNCWQKVCTSSCRKTHNQKQAQVVVASCSFAAAAVRINLGSKVAETKLPAESGHYKKKKLLLPPATQLLIEY